jgi:hypothetical protein
MMEEATFSRPNVPVDSVPQEMPLSPPVDLRLDDEIDSLHLPANFQPISNIPDFAQARQGNVEALQRLFNQALTPYAMTVVEVSWRNACLQLSLSSATAPDQTVVEPLMQAWFAQLELAQVETVELYGQRDGSELPFWRSEFDPNDSRWCNLKPASSERLLETSSVAMPTASVSTAAAAIDLEQLEHLAETDAVGSVSDTSLTESDPWEDWFGESKSSSSSETSSETPEDEGRLFSAADIWPADTVEPEASESAEMTALTETNGAESSPESGKSVSPPKVSAAKRDVAQTFLNRYASGERAFASIDLSETDLTGVNLTLADLHEASFVWANLQDAALYYVNLSGAKLRHANLSKAKLRSANLQGADFLNADLSGADLSWSNLHGANLTGANLTDANLQNAVIERVIMPDGTYLD